jgi:trehalose synthase
MSSSLNLHGDLQKKEIKEYRNFNPKIYAELWRASKKLAGKSVVHINAAPSGGGVAELLRSQIPLENSLGFRSTWLSIRAPRKFFVLTKKIHNLLQGKVGSLTLEEKSYYLIINQELAKSFDKFCEHYPCDLAVVHDPQPLALCNFLERKTPAILRMHIDLLTPNKNVLRFFQPFLEKFEAIILSNRDYISSFEESDRRRLKIIEPAIDPLTDKNESMDERYASRILEQFGINCLDPIVTQISRFDPWKDPLGVIRAYYAAKNDIPNLQLILEGFVLANDDPEATLIFEKIKKHAKGDPDIFLFSDQKVLKDISVDVFINALYTASTVLIQKSIREGFGLTMTEAMWKGKALIAGATSGALLQVKNGYNGIMVSSIEEASRAIVMLIEDPKLRMKLGREARRSVGKKFLFPRYLLDNLKIYQSTFLSGKKNSGF